jgi:glycosyltransferase involved in cell wall biosynthesis
MMEATAETIEREARPAAGDTAVKSAVESAAVESAARGARPVRVLMVGPSLDILGGQAVQASRLLARLRGETELEVDLLPVNPRLPGVLRRLQAIKYVRTLVTELYYLATLLARVGRYDVIHIFSASYTSFVLAPTPAILVAKLYGKRTVLNYRSGHLEDHLLKWPRTAPATMRLVDEIVTPSGYLVDVFAKFNLRARAIFNIVEPGQFRYRERGRLSPAFLSNRNFEWLYNVSCVLRAFAVIQRRHPDARLTVAGYGPQRAELERLAEELKLRQVEFVGRVPSDKMFELLDAADIYLNSPDVDNMPNSVLEAYAAGLPVVTTDAGGIPYIVRDGETGLMVGRDDADALAAAALRLLDDEQLATRIARGAHAECAKYSWANVRGEWLKLYTTLARGEGKQETQTATAGGR